MKLKKSDVVRFLAALVLMAATSVALADAVANPYQPIVERNAFALKPPPPPASDTPPPPPPAPLAKVMLTGITSMFGPSRALLEITEQEPGKASTPRKPILREGERDGSVEVLAIDVDKNVVKIRNGTVETNITFEVQKSPSTPGAAVPALAAAAQPSLGAPVIPAVNSTAGGPTIIGRDGSIGSSGGNSVTIIGAHSASAAPTGISSPNATAYQNNAGYANNTYPNTGAFAASGTANSAGSSQSGLRVPSRPIRSFQPTQPLPGTVDPAAQSAAQLIDMTIQKSQHEQAGRLFPPIPGLDGQ